MIVLKFNNNLLLVNWYTTEIRIRDITDSHLRLVRTTVYTTFNATTEILKEISCTSVAYMTWGNNKRAYRYCLQDFITRKKSSYFLIFSLS